ncbi:hypothetical protein ACS0TY_027799 [Phlomoides rotata]
MLKAVGEREGWFFGGLERRIGDGVNNLFWEYVWVGGIRLKERFPRLFHLNLDRVALAAANMERRGVGGGSGGGDGDVGCLREKLCPPKQGVKDSWTWNRAANEMYSTKAAYEWIFEHIWMIQNVDVEEFKLLLNKYTPEKVRINAWRVLWERIPTITNLIQRLVVPQNVNINCAFCESTLETVRHIFFECSFSYH